MNPPRYDDDMAGPDDLDPSHLQALALRVGNLGNEIGGLERTVADLDKDIIDLKGRCPTKEQMEEITKLLKDRDRQQWFKERVRVWVLGLLAALTSIFVAREYISGFFAWVARVLK